MKLYAQILILIAFALASCSPSVRFASNKKAEPKREASKEKSTASIKERTFKWFNEAIPKIDYSNFNLSALQNDLIAESERWLGTPYRYGGIDEFGIDCSAFVQNVYASLGIRVPRTAQEQFDYAYKVEKNEAAPGDLVFFTNGSKISHVGIYLGEDYIIHSSTSKGVIKQSLESNYWEEKFAGIGRIIDL